MQVLAPSHHVLARYGLTPRDGVTVVPRPVPAADSPVAPRLRNSGRPLRVGMFGQIAPHKGVMDLVSAVESLTPGLIELTVVGGAPTDEQSTYEADCGARIAALSTDSALLPRVPDIGPYARACDVIVNLSHQEAFGRSIVEALAHGALPVVLDRSGPAEIVREAGRGTILSDVSELAECLRVLADGSSAVDTAWTPGAALSRYAPSRATADYWRTALTSGSR
ncbi:glycosyltransferase [Frigoribacterium sp. CFBP9030]|uniref:glycosyltransferase n=1 Tax=Frigoribacterium sp. CFBP9030 TaxID=3096537 RepID=UPI003133AF1E